MITQPRLMNVREIAEQLRVSTKWVYQNQTKLKCVYVGRKVLFRQAAIDEYLQRSEAQAK